MSWHDERRESPDISEDTDVSVSVGHVTGSGQPLSRRRLRSLRTVLFILILVVLAQSIRLQIAAGSLFRREAEQNRVRELIEYAPRGIFLDRHGRPLVQNEPSVELVADPAFLPTDVGAMLPVVREALPDRDLSALGELLVSLSPRDTGTAESLREPRTVLQGLSHRELIALSTRADRLPGLRLETTAVRSYQGDSIFAHLLGYTGKLSPEERATFPNYRLTESVGKSGLERQYEHVLRGQHGARRAEVDAFGAIQHDLGREPPAPGANLRLHVDADVQEHLSAALEQGLKRAGLRRGAAVALDPQSGAVRALVSFPTFPHSDLARGLAPEDVQAILSDASSPLLDRAIQGEYVPGSTFKLAVAAGALEESVASPATAVLSAGGIRVGPWFFPDWKVGGHGRTTLTKALAESVNTYFYTIGGGVGEVTGLGIDRLTAWARRLGVGEPTGIDLPGERPGFLPSPNWKVQSKGEAWYIGDTYHAAIGQGDVLLTPVQLAVLTATIANGGTLYAPRVLDAVENPDGSIRERLAPVVRAERVIQPETASAIRQGMRAAVTEGSARGLADLPVSAAAKTGTAQIGGTERTHAWVTAFAPYDHPELVLVVLLEKAGGGDRYAVPVAREVFARYFLTGS